MFDKNLKKLFASKDKVFNHDINEFILLLLLLFENVWNIRLKIYRFNFANFISVPGLTWQEKRQKYN